MGLKLTEVSCRPSNTGPRQESKYRLVRPWSRGSASDAFSLVMRNHGQRRRTVAGREERDVQRRIGLMCGELQKSQRTRRTCTSNKAPENIRCST